MANSGGFSLLIKSSPVHHSSCVIIQGFLTPNLTRNPNGLILKYEINMQN